MTELAAGSRWRSAIDGAEIIVIKAPGESVRLDCGGHPMRRIDAGDGPEAVIDPDFAGGIQLGKRFVHEETGLAVLCTKPGAGSLSISGQVLALKAAKALPSSD
jgi:hypothetical protein